MSTRKRVLLITRSESRRQQWEEWFDSSEWEIVTASRYSETLQKLTDVWVHAIVIDLQCQNPDDLGDYSGADLAKAPGGLDNRILWIPNNVREALRSAPKLPEDYLQATSGLNLIVEEAKGPSELVRLAEIVYERLEINGRLLLHPEIRGFLAVLIGEMPEYEQAGDLKMAYAVGELEDVVRALFFEPPDTVRVRPAIEKLEYLRSFSFHNGTAILVVQPHTGAKALPRAIKLGKRQLIEKEIKTLDLYEYYVPGPITQLGKERLFPHFGGMQYSVEVPRALDEVCTFREYYDRQQAAKGETAAQDIMRTIRGLFTNWWPVASSRLDITDDHTCERLRDREVPFDDCGKFIARLKENVNLADSKWGELKRCLSAFLTAPVRGLRGLDFKRGSQDYEIDICLDNGRPETYPNPIRFVELARTHNLLSLPSYWCLSTGIQSSCQILLNRQSETWLVDASNTWLAPIWWDFAGLESIVKSELLTGNDPQTLFEWEKVILTPGRFDEPIPEHDGTGAFSAGREMASREEFKLARKIIQGVRELAQELAPGADDMREYYSVLLFHTLRRIMPLSDRWMYKDSITERFRQCHALISAAMICKKLQEWGTQQTTQSVFY